MESLLLLQEKVLSLKEVPALSLDMLFLLFEEAEEADVGDGTETLSEDTSSGPIGEGSSLSAVPSGVAYSSMICMIEGRTAGRCIDELCI